jgi:prepilin-type N-terminal cleavage/methylation domain-containing protein
MLLKNNKGFSLLEILIALALAAIIYGLFNASGKDTRKVLDETADNIEKAINFCQDEASLRNTIVRLHFIFDREPQEYGVEAGPDESFILPSGGSPDSGSMDEREKLKRQTEETNKKFKLVLEFDEKNRQLNEQVTLIGIGSSQQEKLITNISGSIYFYPSGEKDSAIIILGTQDELLALIVDPFSLDVERIYRPIEGKDKNKKEELTNLQAEIAKELFDEWLKEK